MARDSYGGFLPLELSSRPENIDFFRRRGLSVASARAALKLLLLSDRSINKIYIPAFSCCSILETIKHCGIEYSLYHLTEEFLPEKVVLKSNEKLLYINYFGINDYSVSKVTRLFSKNSLIIDNSQALFSEPIEKIYATIYSPRKYIGIPDGGYIYTSVKLDTSDVKECKNDIAHLCERRWGNRELAYKMFLDHEEKFSSDKLMNISQASHDFLMACDLSKISKCRKRNFNFLSHILNNHLFVDLNESTPLTFPLIHKDTVTTKKKLIEHKIFTPTYWSESNNHYLNSFESYLVNSLIHLPIDQRYNEDDMSFISDLVNSL